jgi:hypothetical protein
VPVAIAVPRVEQAETHRVVDRLRTVGLLGQSQVRIQSRLGDLDAVTRSPELLSQRQ